MIAVIVLGMALGLDSFRASLAIGAAGVGASRAARIASAFAVCDGLAPCSAWRSAGRRQSMSGAGRSGWPPHS